MSDLPKMVPARPAVTPPEPTLSSLLTRIEILERHVERLEQAAKFTRRKDRSMLKLALATLLLLATLAPVQAQVIYSPTIPFSPVGQLPVPMAPPMSVTCMTFGNITRCN